MLNGKEAFAISDCPLETEVDAAKEAALDMTLDWVYQAAGYRQGMIHYLLLSGREPFANLKTLRRISSYAGSSGLSVAVHTNAFWASSREEALDTLQQLPAVDSLTLCVNPACQPAVPFNHIEHALWASKELHRHCRVELFGDGAERDLALMQERLGSLVNSLDDIAFGGFSPSDHRLPSAEPAASPCSGFAYPVVLPDGKVVACEGSRSNVMHSCPLCLGSLQERSLKEILDSAELNPVLHIIRIWGPQKLVALMREYGFGDLLPHFASEETHCELCHKLLSTLKVVEMLERIFEDSQLLHTLAYARMHYLGEPAMIQQYRLNGSESIDLASMALFTDW